MLLVLFWTKLKNGKCISKFNDDFPVEILPFLKEGMPIEFPDGRSIRNMKILNFDKIIGSRTGYWCLKVEVKIEGIEDNEDLSGWKGWEELKKNLKEFSNW